MKSFSPGFSVLFVLMLVTAFSIAGLAFMRTSSFLTRLAIAREAKEYQYWATYGLMNYAIAVIRASANIPTEPIFLDSWPTSQAPYQGLIRATAANDQIIITVQLINGKITHLEHTRIIPIPVHLSA